MYIKEQFAASLLVKMQVPAHIVFFSYESKDETGPTYVRRYKAIMYFIGYQQFM